MAYRKYLSPCLPVVVAGLLASSLATQAVAARPADDDSQKARLIVLTDISSITSGVREADDAQSMIRLMMYSNDFDIEGLIASSSLQHGHVVRPQNIRKIVDAYGKCRANLVVHNKSFPRIYNKSYPTTAHLRSVIKSGQPNADRNIPIFQSIGNGKDTEASNWIIRTVDKRDKRFVWIAVWGGEADLAQALWKVRNTRSAAEVKKFVAKLRVVGSPNQDSTGSWINSQFPDLYYMTRSVNSRGMYRGGDQSLVSSKWVQRNIKGHGALGTIYPNYRGGDTYSYKLGPVEGIKGGDSGTFMGMIHNGLNKRNQRNKENWGGIVKQDPNNDYRSGDAIDKVGNYKHDLSPYWAAVYKWRPDFQADYQAHFDYCSKPYSQANHMPVTRAGIAPEERIVPAATRIKMDAGNWSDPDGNNLTYRWSYLDNEGTYSKPVRIEDKTSPTTSFKVPDVKIPQSISMLLTVKDNGKPALTSYKRFHFVVFPHSYLSFYQGT